MTTSPPFMELLPILLLILFTTSYPHPAMSKPHNNITDLESLLAFKSVITDPHSILATNWTTNASFCNWIGIRCNLKRQRVIKLDLDSFSLQGTISPRIANLSFLSHLSLENNSLTGPIPHTISRLRRLATLNLSQNYLSGPIPRNIFNMSSLIGIDLSHNNLTGNLPNLIKLPRLENILLSYNQLSGEIPSSSFAGCLSIRELSLSNNELTGTIPEGFGNMTYLSVLYLGSNGLHGNIPASLGNLSKITELDLAFNYLEGVIPEEFNYLQHLQYLNLGVNNLNGSIPPNIFNCSELYFLQLCVNNFSGFIPASLGKSLPLLTILNMRANQFTGGLDFITSLSNCRDLKYLFLSDNRIEGVLPDSVGNLSSNLEIFRIQSNFLQGKIPAGFGNLSSLILLDLEVNEITGEIPSALAMLKRIQGLYLGHDRISGVIPSELGLMTSLGYIFLEDNLLSGAIPDLLGNISGLQTLSLASNKLSSTIPNGLWRLRGLVELNLSGNALVGSVPLQIGNLKSIDTLDLSRNYLSGNITNAVGDLQMLEHLDLSNNHFHGEIPQSLGKLVGIEYLNLSNNSLSGIIPESLAHLHYLYALDLSFNKLEGQIPSGRVFSNLSIPSLIGNTALCGAPQLGFSPCPSSVVTSHSKSKIYLLKYVLPAVAFIVIVLLTCFYLLIFRSRHREIEPSSETPPLYNLKPISYHELLRATDGYSEENLLGKGRGSSVFKAKLDDGSLAAVKVLNVEVPESSRSFEVECHALSSVRHRNLIKIISTCCSSNVKALVLQFMPNGSLEKWLHSPQYHLDLLQRINVMVDVSLALEYLHHDHHQIIVHCDLKPSNVLFDEDMVGHVSDFGISRLLLGGRTSLLSTNTPGTIGYMAPEYGASGNVSRAADVYSFGILLLETFTRKRPSDPMFDGEVSLRQWVSKAYPADVLEVVDCNLLREELPNPKQQSEFLSKAHNSLTSIINMGLLCSRDLPKERAPMRDVVRILEKIKMEYLSEAGSYHLASV